MQPQFTDFRAMGKEIPVGLGIRENRRALITCFSRNALNSNPALGKNARLYGRS
jgi:hypothetical protein